MIRMIFTKISNHRKTRQVSQLLLICLRTSTIPILTLVFVFPGTSCISVLPDGSDGNNGNGGDNGNGDPGNGDDPKLPEVRLIASNPSPQPNEELILTCQLVFGDGPAVFSFDPRPPRLQVDSGLGIARIVSSETDVGVALSFQCQVEIDGVESEPSNTVVVVATSPP